MSYIPPDPPPPPDPVVVAQWAGQIRTVIALVGGLGLGGAWLQHLTDAQISNDVTAILTMFGLASWALAGVWSWWQKRQAANAARTVAVASAVASAHKTQDAGTPTPVTVAPAAAAGVAPVATMVSHAEAAMVPLPPPDVAPRPAAQ